MAGHSKWANIKHKKAATDQKKQKHFQKINKEMASAIKKGGSDPDSNAALRLVIEKAKSVNMPKDNIKRALDKATKEKDSADLIELTYEGYGPGGVAIVVECLTDNNNRTSANIKANFNKRGGNLGATGSVSYLFKSKGQIVFESDKTEDEWFEILMEAEILDFKNEEGLFIVETNDKKLDLTKKLIEKNGVTEFIQAEVTKIASTTVELSDEDFEKHEKMIDAIEDNDDVINVYSNVA